VKDHRVLEDDEEDVPDFQQHQTSNIKDGFNQGRTKGASRTLSTIMVDWSSAGRRRSRKEV
jgi:hypothetical protein